MLGVKNVGAVAKIVNGIHHRALVAKRGRICLGIVQARKPLNSAVEAKPASAAKFYSGVKAKLLMGVGEVHFVSSCATTQYKPFCAKVNREFTNVTR